MVKYNFIRKFATNACQYSGFNMNFSNEKSQTSTFNSFDNALILKLFRAMKNDKKVISQSAGVLTLKLNMVFFNNDILCME